MTEDEIFAEALARLEADGVITISGETIKLTPKGREIVDVDSKTTEDDL